MFTVIAKGMGHGLGYSNYPATVEFSVSDDSEEQEIYDKARRELRKKTACDYVTIKTIEIGTMIYSID